MRPLVVGASACDVIARLEKGRAHTRPNCAREARLWSPSCHVKGLVCHAEPGVLFIPKYKEGTK